MRRVALVCGDLDLAAQLAQYSLEELVQNTESLDSEVGVVPSGKGADAPTQRIPK